MSSVTWDVKTRIIWQHEYRPSSHCFLKVEKEDQFQPHTKEEEEVHGIFTSMTRSDDNHSFCLPKIVPLCFLASVA